MHVSHFSHDSHSVSSGSYDRYTIYRKVVWINWWQYSSWSMSWMTGQSKWITPILWIFNICFIYVHQQKYNFKNRVLQLLLPIQGYWTQNVHLCSLCWCVYFCIVLEVSAPNALFLKDILTVVPNAISELFAHVVCSRNTTEKNVVAEILSLLLYYEEEQLQRVS